MKRAISILIGLITATLLVTPAFADGPGCNHGAHGQAHATTAANPAGGSAEAEKAVTTPAYPVDVCVVSGQKLGSMGDPVVKTYNGREVRFCCAGCVDQFEADQAKFLKKLDDAIIVAQKDSYPLKTCVVSGEALGGMGEPADYVYQNQLIRFCCAGCIPAFEKEPAKFMAKLAAPSAEPTEGHEGHAH